MKTYTVPTGHILVVKGEHGDLECLSLADYGKEKNVKADFMGITRKIEGVPHGTLMPLEKKWVITISSQYGCSMWCTFCDAWKVPNHRNATFIDLVMQVQAAMSMHPDITHTERLNLHYARMGEPTMNRDNVLASAYYMAGVFKNIGFHPVVSTMCPTTDLWPHFMRDWLLLKRNLGGNAGLQLSINTTSEKHRRIMFNEHARSLHNISYHFKDITNLVTGRKIALNFALTDAPIDANLLARLFDPKHFMCKITPMHATKSCADNKIETANGYISYHPYADVEDRLKAAGFDVIVFIPSVEEDESRITCGNAILSGTLPKTYTVVES